VTDPSVFSTAPAGLPAVVGPRVVRLRDGDGLDLDQPRSARVGAADRAVHPMTAAGTVHNAAAGLHGRLRGVSVPVLAGVVAGLAQAASPLGFWWLPAATVYASGLILIAAIYIGFAVADGRPKVIVVEVAVALAFVVIATLGITGPPWLIVAGLAAHGVKDYWQHRSQFVANTRWWPPFCAATDWVAAAVLVLAITTGVIVS
jgi:hypothetical protein